MTMYCKNCGSEIDQNANVCPYCGETSNSTDIIKKKDIKIREMEQKIAELERIVKEQPRSAVKKK